MGADDIGSCAVGGHVCERVMEFLHERAVAAPAEGNALCLAAKAHIQAAVFAGMIVKILLQRALHPSGSVNIAAA